jgi:hypothetical protein
MMNGEATVPNDLSAIQMQMNQTTNEVGGLFLHPSVYN